LAYENDRESQNRLKKIEDRKMEILLEIARINDNYSKKVSKLNSEYKQLGDDYYNLKIEVIKKKQKA
jgi:hypothetical protein